MELFKIILKSKKEFDGTLEKILSKIKYLKEREILIENINFERRKNTSTVGENAIATYVAYDKTNVLFGVNYIDRVILGSKKTVETSEEYMVLLENNEKEYCINLLRMLKIKNEKYWYIRTARICINDEEEIKLWQKDSPTYSYETKKECIDYNRLNMERNNLKNLIKEIIDLSLVKEKLKSFRKLSAILNSYLDCFELKSILKIIENNLELPEEEISIKKKPLYGGYF